MPVLHYQFLDISLANLNHMGRKAEVYVNDKVAGILGKVSSQLFVFRYEDSYYNNLKFPAISLQCLRRSRNINQSTYSLFSLDYSLKVTIRSYNADFCALIQMTTLVIC